MIKKLYFVTTSLLKFQQVKEWIYELDSSIEIEQKVLDIPEFPTVSTPTHTTPNPIRIPSSYISYNFSETPLHLCDPKSIVTQYRCSDSKLPSRIVDISKNQYSEQELQWYADPESTIPPPMRLVMICMLRCYLCGDFQKSDELRDQIKSLGYEIKDSENGEKINKI